MTMNAVSEDIKTLLNGEVSLSLTDGTDLFAFEWGNGEDGAEIDQQVLILDTEALDSELKNLYENPTFQIIVRGAKNESGKEVHDRARPIYDFLRQQLTQDIGSVSYLQFEPIANVLPLGKDDNGRHGYSMNFYTFRNPI